MAGTGITNDLSILSDNFGYLPKGLFLGFDKPIVDTVIPTTAYGLFRYEKDGGGGSADTLAFLSGQTAATPAASTSGSAFWTMLNEVNTATTPDGSSLIFEPSVDYGGTSNVMNRAYIGYHNPLFATYSYYLNGGDGSAAYPSHSFWSDVNTGMYLSGSDVIGFSAGGTLRATVSSSGISVTATVASDIEANINSSTGLLTKVSSSRRYKDNIADLDINTENIYDLRPVSFDWKSNGKSDFGYIAEEVHEILPELTVYDDKNRPEAVKYKQLSILMLEELKKLREEVKNLKEKL
jgi:hypothetical protein